MIGNWFRYRFFSCWCISSRYEKLEKPPIATGSASLKYGTSCALTAYRTPVPYFQYLDPEGHFLFAELKFFFNSSALKGSRGENCLLLMFNALLFCCFKNFIRLLLISTPLTETFKIVGRWTHVFWDSSSARIAYIIEIFVFFFRRNMHIIDKRAVRTRDWDIEMPYTLFL